MAHRRADDPAEVVDVVGDEAGLVVDGVGARRRKKLVRQSTISPGGRTKSTRLVPTAESGMPS